MRLLKSIAFIYICIGLYLFVVQRSFIYFPTPDVKTPYTEITYDFENAAVKVIALNRGKEKAILYFGGNGEAVENNAPELHQMYPQQSVYLVKYRGYGGSTGSPTEEDLYSDALKIFDSLKQKHSEVSIIGRSLGSGIATLVASKRDIKRLVLVTPYDSIESVAQASFPIYPMFILLKDKYKSIDRVASISAKTLLLLAENDQVIKKSHSVKLAKSFQPDIANLVIIKNTGHNTISYSPQYKRFLQQFLTEER